MHPPTTRSGAFRPFFCKAQGLTPPGMRQPSPDDLIVARDGVDCLGQFVLHEVAQPGAHPIQVRARLHHDAGEWGQMPGSDGYIERHRKHRLAEDGLDRTLIAAIGCRGDPQKLRTADYACAQFAQDRAIAPGGAVVAFIDDYGLDAANSQGAQALRPDN